MVCDNDLTMKHISTDHIHFFVTDLDAAIEFYQDLGFEFIHKLEHGDFAILVDDVERACKEYKAKGYEVDGPVYNKDSKRKIITLRDPNGFLVQLVETA